MIAHTREHGDNLVVVSYERAKGEVEAEFCTTGQAAELIDAVMARKELCLLPKYGRPPMLVLEFSKGSAQALALEFYTENAQTFAPALSRISVPLRHWRNKYGGNCTALMFTVVCASEHHDEIESLIRRSCAEDSELVPLLQSLEIRVSLFIDPRGNPVKEYILVEASYRTEVVKAWWRFW